MNKRVRVVKAGACMDWRPIPVGHVVELEPDVAEYWIREGLAVEAGADELETAAVEIEGEPAEPEPAKRSGRGKAR